MKDAATFWDQTAEKYSKTPISDEESYQYTLGRIRKNLNATDHVLELGCGTGSTALLLSSNAAQITASDISPNMIQIGKDKAKDQNIDNIVFLASDISEITAKDKPYDAVLALNLIHLLDDVPAAIEKVHSLLKPEGLFISKTFCFNSGKVPLKFRLIKMILPLMQWLGKAPFVNFFSSDSLENTIKNKGFEILETGDHPTRFIIAKKITS